MEHGETPRSTYGRGPHRAQIPSLNSRLQRVRRENHHPLVAGVRHGEPTAREPAAPHRL